MAEKKQAAQPTASEERRAQIAIWLMTFSVLAWIPGGFSRFVAAKLLVTVIACALSATVRGQHRLPRQVSGLFTAGLVLVAIAALAGETPVASLLGRWPRYEGLPVLGVYAAAAWSGARLLSTRARWDVLLSAVAAMACVLGACSALAAIGWSPAGSSDVLRDGSLLGNATDQGLIGMVAVALLARPAWESLRELHLFGLAGGALTVVLSGSRASILLTVVVLVGLALAERRRLLRPALVGVGVVVVASLALAPARERLANTHTLRGRWLEWEMAGRAATDHLGLGIGPSRFVDVVGRYETPAWTTWAGQGIALDSPHNWPLQVLLAGGLPLLLCALALVVVTARTATMHLRRRSELAGAYAAVLAYGVAMLANFTSPLSTCLAAFLAGALVAVPRDAAAPERPSVRWATLGSAVVASLALLAICVSEVLLQRGLEQTAQERPSAALDSFDAALALRPGDYDARMIAAQGMTAVASATADPDAADDAAELARRSLSGTPDTYESRVALGVAQMTRGEYDDARHSLDRAIEGFPRRSRAYVQRAVLRAGLGDVPGARSDLRRAVDLGDRSARRLKRQLKESAAAGS